MKITDYTLACENNHERFQAEVKQMIATGWQPIGGVATEHGFFFQAMVKYESTTPDQPEG